MSLNPKINGCGALAETVDFVEFPGRYKKILGPSSAQHRCGAIFARFILAERGIRLCQKCCVKNGIEW